MQLFEIALLLLTLCLPFGMYWQNQIPFKQIGLGLLATTLLLHLMLEGLRWQMVPIYLAAIVVGLCLVKNYAFFKGAWYRKLLSGLFLAINIGIGFFLSTTLPVFDFPTPTGKYHVGSQWIQLDTDRAESITEAPTDTRTLMVKAWYPSMEKGTPEPYLDQSERLGFATKYGLPQNTFNYLDKVITNTSPSVAVAGGTFPILLFSHGYYSNATGYQGLIEEVVSQGFIVLNLNHTFESVGTQFSNGEMHLYDVAFDRKNNNEEMAKMAWEATEAFHKAEGLDAQIVAIRPTLKNYVAADITKRWAADIGSVLAEMPNWATSSFLAGHLDTSKIGVFGHSQGGAAAGQALLDYPSLQAGINLDGVQWGNMVDTALSKPFLLASSDWPDTHPNFNAVAYHGSSAKDFFIAKIKQSGHSNFMDIPRVINLPALNEAGAIEPEQATQITAALVTQFFNKYLNGSTIELNDLTTKYPALLLKKQVSND